MQTQSHLDMFVNYISSLKIGLPNFTSELANGSAGLGLLQVIGFILFIGLIIWGIVNYSNNVSENHNGYELMDLKNVAIHGAIWLVFWFMVICNCYGWDESQPSCPAIANTILFLLFWIPVYRTNKVVQNVGESIMINVFQSIIGFLIGAFLMFVFTYNNHKDK